MFTHLVVKSKKGMSVFISTLLVKKNTIHRNETKTFYISLFPVFREPEQPPAQFIIEHLM